MSFTFRHKLILYILLLATIAMVNYFARKKCAYSYAHLINYNKLYVTDDLPRISYLNIVENDSLLMELKGKNINNKSIINVSNSYLHFFQKGNFIKIKPLPNEKTWFLRLDNATDSFKIFIDYTPSSIYKNVNNSSNDIYEVSSSALPIITYDVYKTGDWQIPNLLNNTNEQKKLAEIYLTDSINISQTDSTIEKINKIANFILTRTSGKEGIPSDSVSELAPIQMLQAIQKGTSKIWCGNFTAIFSYFTFYAHIPTRLVTCGNYENKVATGVHVFNEVYIKELNQWVYTDLTAKNVFITKGNQYLNTIDIQRLLRYSINDSNLTAYHFTGEKCVPMPFYTQAEMAKYYFNASNTFYFFYADFLAKGKTTTFFKRLQNFFYSKPYYAIYSDNVSIPNGQFYFRIYSNYILISIILLGLFIFLFIAVKKCFFKTN